MIRLIRLFRRAAALPLQLCAILFAVDAHGHALEPGYLEVREIDSAIYAVVWKKPAVGGAPMPISARLPQGCDTRSGDDFSWDGTAFYARWTTRCPDGIRGGRIAIAGLENTATDVLVRIQFNDGTTRTQRLTPTETTFQIAKLPSALAVVETYFELGIEHILLGIDHLLFVFALLLLVSGARRLVATITAFTAAHSITLAAATLDWVRLPAPPLEAVIALSIAFVAAEILQTQKGNTSLTIRQPWLVAFTFGLLHGFGFAGALAEIGLPSVEIPLALLFFNVGVEAGQLLFIAAVSCVSYIGRRLFTNRIAGLLPDLEPSQGPSKGPSQRPVEEQSEGPAQHLAIEERTSSVALSGATVAAYAIGGIAMFWVCERTAAFLL